MAWSGMLCRPWVSASSQPGAPIAEREREREREREKREREEERERERGERGERERERLVTSFIRNGTRDQDERNDYMVLIEELDSRERLFSEES